MNKYRVRVSLDEEYDDIEANSEDKAVDIALDLANSGGSWSVEVELLEEQEGEE